MHRCRAVLLAGDLWQMFVKEGATGLPGQSQGASVHGVLCSHSTTFASSLQRSAIAFGCRKTAATKGSGCPTGFQTEYLLSFVPT